METRLKIPLQLSYHIAVNYWLPCQQWDHILEFLIQLYCKHLFCMDCSHSHPGRLEEEVELGDRDRWSQVGGGVWVEGENKGENSLEGDKQKHKGYHYYSTLLNLI